MTKETYEAISDMMGDNKTDFIAKDLQQAYENLKKDLENVGYGVPIVSDNPIEEVEFILKHLHAIEVVYSWYATDDLKD